MPTDIPRQLIDLLDQLKTPRTFGFFDDFRNVMPAERTLDQRWLGGPAGEPQ